MAKKKQEKVAIPIHAKNEVVQEFFRLVKAFSEGKLDHLIVICDSGEDFYTLLSDKEDLVYITGLIERAKFSINVDMS